MNNENCAITPAALMELVRVERRVRIAGWSITADVHALWVSNPYGQDVGYYGNDEIGCRAILQQIARADIDDTLETQWGQL